MRSFSIYLLTIIVLAIISCSGFNPRTGSESVTKDSIVNGKSRNVTLPMIDLLDSCSCDTNSVKQFVQQKSYNSLSKYDLPSFSKEKFYDLDSQINRMLWFRDIENPNPTKFTALWDSYWSENYYADPRDFLSYYSGKSDIPIAFIFGPNSDLWAYHIFVIKKVQCCYLITRSYYRHNRFTYKAFSVFNKHKLDSLFNTINKINLVKLDSSKMFGYMGYFVENSGKNKFTVDFENEIVKVKDSTHAFPKRPKQEILDLYDFVDKKFHWMKTYGL